MVFQVQMNLVDLPKALKGDASQEIIREELVKATAENLIDLRNSFSKGSPTGLGILRNSWIIEKPKAKGKFVIGNVSSSVVQALIVDQGARPHFPPVSGVGGGESALAPWIRRKLGVSDPDEIEQIAFKISRKFKKSGIKKRRIFSNIFKKKTPSIAARLEVAKERIIKRLSE